MTLLTPSRLGNFVRSKSRVRCLASAFTLIEVLLVLSILVVALAVASPSLDGMMTARAIQNAADRIQIDLSKARLEAVKTGQTQVFRAQVGQGSYLTQPWLKASDSVNVGSGAATVLQSGQTVKQSTSSRGTAIETVDTSQGQKKLDGNIIIADAQVASETRSLAERSLSDSVLSATSGWSQPLLFYPDGSSSTAHIVIQDSRGRRLAIQVRGITGQARIVEVASTGARK